jgi:hypothetical protein
MLLLYIIKIGMFVNTSGNIIKNPLTIIAIFAGIVEVGSNTVLPFLTSENQSTYIWFLMLFPFVLVLIFFFILYNKHHVLYAPSDFNDEKNFNELLYNTRKSTTKEVDTKIKNEIQILNEQSKKLEEQVEKNKKEPASINLDTKFEKFNNLIKNKRDLLVSLETKLLENFSFINNYNIKRNITLETREGKLITDGFIKNENNINIIEVKILSKFILSRHIIKMFIERKNSVLEIISKEHNLTLSFVILIPDNVLIDRFKKFEDYLNDKYSNFNIKIYPNIINEINEQEIEYLDLLNNKEYSISF